MTKVYIVVGCYEMDDYKKVEVQFTQPFGSVTEVCKFLKKMYQFPEKDSRQLIITAFARKTKLWISMPDGRSVRISQHKVDAEVRLHGNPD